MVCDFTMQEELSHKATSFEVHWKVSGMLMKTEVYLDRERKTVKWIN
jgi:hypothetical protein